MDGQLSQYVSTGNKASGRNEIRTVHLNPVHLEPANIWEYIDRPGLTPFSEVLLPLFKKRRRDDDDYWTIGDARGRDT